MSRCAYIPYFKINAPIFCCPLFFKEYLNPHVMIIKMEHTVDYHPCLSELTSRIHLLMFLWAPKSFISPEGFFPQQNGGRIMELKKWPRLYFRGYWQQVLINSTIFATFTFFVSVLLCHDLDSSMLKCVGSLT